MNIKEFLKGIHSLLAFKSYTTMPRPLEIAYGILGWAHLIILIIALKRIIFDLC